MVTQSEQDQLRLEYIPLDLALLWDDNQKRHDITSLLESIERYGFKDPPKFEPTLNDGRGGLVEGNGRFEALGEMRRKLIPAPRGIIVGEDEGWLVPVLFGVDAASSAAASAYGIDHNSLTLAGAGFSMYEHMQLWEDGFTNQLQQLSEAGQATVVFDEGDIYNLQMLSEALSAVPEPEQVPDIEGFTEPELAVRIVLQFEDAEERDVFMEYLGLPLGLKTVRYDFSATNLYGKLP